MSEGIAKGRHSRRILTVAAAVFAVALMLAAPLFAAADTEADFPETEIGYSSDLTNPTDATLEKFFLSQRGLFASALVPEMEVFNPIIIDGPVVTVDSFTAKVAEGQKIDSKSKTEIQVYNVSAESVEVVYTFDGSGTLIRSNISEYSESYQLAAQKIADYFGANVENGDKLVVTGTVKDEDAMEFRDEYQMVDDANCVIKRSVITWYEVADVDVTIKLVKGTTEKTIQARSTIKGFFDSAYNYEYSSETITSDTDYTARNVRTQTYTGETYYTVDGVQYNVTDDFTPAGDRTGKAKILAQSSIVIDDWIKNRVAGLPAPSEGVSVTKTYESANDAFGTVVMDAVGNDIMKILLIGVGVFIGIVLLIAIIIVILVVRKSRRS